MGSDWASDPEMRRPWPHLQHRVTVQEPMCPLLQVGGGADPGPASGRVGLPATDTLQGDVLSQLHAHWTLGEHGHCRGPCPEERHRWYTCGALLVTRTVTGPCGQLPVGTGLPTVPTKRLRLREGARPRERQGAEAGFKPGGSELGIGAGNGEAEPWGRRLSPCTLRFTTLWATP